MREYRLKCGRVGDAMENAYKKIEASVADGYRKIENGVVMGYRKIEDAFVERFMKPAGDSEKGL